MKRKITAVLVIVLVVTAISASVVFASDNGEQGEKSVIKSMFDAMRSWSQQAQDNGEMTKEEAKDWDKHFKDMEKYHEKNGLAGHCGGSSQNGNGDVENQSRIPGNRNGMMRNFSNNSL